MLAPQAYQITRGKRVAVSSAFVLLPGNKVMFHLGNFDRSQKVIIDPVVSFASFIAADVPDSSLEIGSVAVDSSGNLFVSGKNVFQLYLTKVDPTGATIFSNYISGAGGGSGQKNPVQVDAQGNVYLAGIAGTSDFPTTSTNLGTCGTTCNDGFVAKFDGSGSIIYSTLLGSGQILPNSMVINAAGNAYVTGLAEGVLPTVNAFQSTNSGSAFFAELNTLGTGYEFASYLGSGTSGSCIALDQVGNVYIAGGFGVNGGTVPLRGEFQSGGTGFFLNKFTPDGQTLLFGTLLAGSGAGGSGAQPSGLEMLAVGLDGTVYLAGNASTGAFPYTINAVRHPLGNGMYGASTFAMALNPSLTGLTYSTFLGEGFLSAGVVDANGDLYLSGSSEGDVPTNANAVVSDVQAYSFFLELDPKGNIVTSSAFSGMGTIETPSSLALDQAGNLYLAGTFPVPPAGHNPICMNPDPITVGSVGYEIEAAFPNCNLEVKGVNEGGFVAKVSPLSQPQISLSSVLPSLVLRNVGSADLHISDITVSGGLTKISGNCGSTVLAGTSCMLTLTDSNGLQQQGSVTITSDAHPSVQTFTPLLNEAPGGATSDFLWVDASHLSFAAQQIGVPSAPKTITIWNAGLAPAQLGAITVPSPSALTTNCPSSLAPGSSCTAQVTWTPVAGAAPGPVTVGSESFQFFGSLIGNTGPLLVSVQNGSIITFGTQTIGNPALYQTITLMNVGNQTMSPPTAAISGTSAYSFAGNTCSDNLAPQQSCVLAVIFQPKSVGDFQGTLSIAGGGSSFSIGLNGTGATGIPAPPSATIDSSVAFGNVAIGSASTQTVTVTNSGSSSLSIAQLGLSGTNASDFSVPPGQCPTVAAGTSCPVTLGFNPSALGTRIAALTITDNAINTPQTVSLSGTGVGPIADLSTTSLNFGNQDQGTSSGPETVTLTNTGNEPLAITDIATTPEFSQTNTCGTSITAAASCQISIVFSPSQTGNQSGSLTVKDDAIGGSQVVTLTGDGTVPGFTLGVAGGGPNSASVTSGQTANYALTVSASAGFSGPVTMICSGAPANADCTVNPASLSLAAGGTSVVNASVATEISNQALAGTLSEVTAGFGFLILFSVPLLLRIRKQLPTYYGLALVIGAAISFLWITACGSGHNGQPSTSLTSSTAPGAYTLTVTATSGAVSSSETLTLTVK